MATCPAAAACASRSIFEGEITLRGLLVVGETGRVTCKEIKANTVVVAGAVRGNITAEKVEIRATGRVWGDVITTSFSTEEGAFLRGQIRMEEEIEIVLPPARTFSEGMADGSIPPMAEKTSRDHQAARDENRKETREGCVRHHAPGPRQTRRYRLEEEIRIGGSAHVDE